MAVKKIVWVDMRGNYHEARAEAEHADMKHILYDLLITEISAADANELIRRLKMSKEERRIFRDFIDSCEDENYQRGYFV